MDSKMNKGLSVKEIILIPWNFREISIAILILFALSAIADKPSDSALTANQNISTGAQAVTASNAQESQKYEKASEKVTDKLSKDSRAVASELPYYSRFEK